MLSWNVRLLTLRPKGSVLIMGMVLVGMVVKLGCLMRSLHCNLHCILDSGFTI